jgi:uncharacterized protein YbjT (DUF2867 family)
MSSITPVPAPTERDRATTVLVLGGDGFIAGFLIAALHRRGWRVLRGVRRHGADTQRDDERVCDFTTMAAPEQWRDALAGVDAVVNAAGILRETGRQTFDAIHVDGPLALARACVDAGVRRFVQISALGLPADGAFIASKHRFDEALAALPLSAVALRPSVVYSATGSYGGTSMLRALAALPFAQALPGDGRWPIQPIAAEDLGELVARAVDNDVRGIHEVGGPEVMSLRDYQNAWRAWLRIPGTRAIAVPEALVGLQVKVGEWLGMGPMGETTWRMLRRGNVVGDDALPTLRERFDFTPSPLREALAAHPSQVQDRWQAQLYFLAPLLKSGVVALWLLSAWVGFATPAAQIEALAAGSPLATLAPVALARATAGLDLLLAAWLLIGWRPRPCIALMLLSVLAYTLVFGALLPALWLDPLGGLAKNLALLPALAVLWVLVDRR